METITGWGAVALVACFGIGLLRGLAAEGPTKRREREVRRAVRRYIRDVRDRDLPAASAFGCGTSARTGQ